MNIIRDENHKLKPGTTGKFIVITGPNHISNNPLFRQFKSIVERCSINDITFSEDDNTATIACIMYSPLKCATVTEVYQRLEDQWKGVFETEPLTFLCVYQGWNYHALFAPTYVITEASFAYAPNSHAIAFTGKVLDQSNPNAYDIKVKVRKLIAARERADHELDMLVKDAINETEEENNA